MPEKQGLSVTDMMNQTDKQCYRLEDSDSYNVSSADIFMPPHGHYGEMNNRESFLFNLYLYRVVRLNILKNMFTAALCMYFFFNFR